jgi:glycosyltransferase involved in cell wall biosynthesis
MPESKLNEQKSPLHSSNLPLASIIITSYNYEKFLPRAIDSALQQTYPVKEIIVVDDGSTDNSRHIINSYGDQIIPVFKENGGLISATNAGFFASHGEIIFLLDADDIFFPHKVETMVNYFLQVMPQTPEVLIYHRLEVTNEEGIILFYRPGSLRTLHGHKKNSFFERLTDPEAVYHYVQKWGFLRYVASPASGLSLTRSLASKIFPLPEEMKRPQDTLLVYTSMLLGAVYGTSQVLGSYVLQGDNVSLNSTGFKGNDALIKIMENFLNDILQKMNKPRIISYYDSPDAIDYYRYCGSTKGLLKLTYKVPTRYFCWGTIWFSIRTLCLCLKIVLGIKKGPRVTKKSRLYAQAKKKLAKQDSQQQTSVSKGE